MDKDKDKITEVENEMSLEKRNNRDIISYFENDKLFTFLLKKTEKLTAAIYLVTNLMSDNEPLKWTLRKKAGEVLTFNISYKDGGAVADRKDYLGKIKIKVLELTSLLEVAYLSGLVSFMNFSILKEEFFRFVEALSSNERGVKDESFSRSFFHVPDEEVLGRNLSTVLNESSNQIGLNASKTSSNIKDNSIEKDNQKRTNRQEMIINLLKKKADLNIKDIAQYVRGCSEKTVQRELISLIEAGIVKKEGERRWSRYSLKQEV